MDTQYGVTGDSEVAGRTAELLERLGSDMTLLDFARVAMACIDQALLPVKTQQKIADLIANHFGHEVRW
jgi:hypothetical protein